MKKYLYGILKYTRHPFTNARTEGMNSKIQLLKHRARGYRNRENFGVQSCSTAAGRIYARAEPG